MNNGTLKTIGTFIAIVGSIAGAIIYLTTTYQTIDAAEKDKQSAIKTFEMQQQAIEQVIKTNEYKHDVEQLEFLYSQKIILEKMCASNDSDLLKEKLDIIKTKIEHLEDKLAE